MSTKKSSVLMIVEHRFHTDARVRKEAYYLKQWYRMYVIALKERGETFYEQSNGITIYRIPELPDFGLGKIRYMFQYFYFTFLSVIIFITTLPFNRYKVIHTHNPPDTLFIVGLIGKIFGINYIFDHHDLAPNLYKTRFSKKNDFIYNIMLLCEKLSCKLANAIITTNETYKQIEIERHNVSSDKIYIVRNNPIIEECVLSNNNRINPEFYKKDNKKWLLFIGAINPQDGVTELLQILHYLVYSLNEKNFICNIVGGGDSLPSAKQLADDLRLGNYVNFTGQITERKIVKEHFFLADIGIEPAPMNDLNLHSTFIKVMEYMAASIPIVAFDLKETSFSADGSAILIEPNDIKGFALAIKKLLHDEGMRKSLGEIGKNRILNELNWEKSTYNLYKAYDSLS